MDGLGVAVAMVSAGVALVWTFQSFGRRQSNSPNEVVGAMPSMTTLYAWIARTLRKHDGDDQRRALSMLVSNSSVKEHQEQIVLFLPGVVVGVCERLHHMHVYSNSFASQ